MTAYQWAMINMGVISLALIRLVLSDFEIRNKTTAKSTYVFLTFLGVGFLIWAILLLQSTQGN